MFYRPEKVVPTLASRLGLPAYPALAEFVRDHMSGNTELELYL